MCEGGGGTDKATEDSARERVVVLGERGSGVVFFSIIGLFRVHAEDLRMRVMLNYDKRRAFGARSVRTVN